MFWMIGSIQKLRHLVIFESKWIFQNKDNHQEFFPFGGKWSSMWGKCCESSFQEWNFTWSCLDSFFVLLTYQRTKFYQEPLTSFRALRVVMDWKSFRPQFRFWFRFQLCLPKSKEEMHFKEWSLAPFFKVKASQRLFGPKTSETHFFWIFLKIYNNPTSHTWSI